jgi:hypothetical protein
MANGRRSVTCSIEGCDNAHLARGWCDKHYRRWKATGDPLAVKHIAAYPPDATCHVDGCPSRPASFGYCAKHYARWVRHGDTSVVRQSAPYAADAVCPVSDCGRRVASRGYCARHAANLRNYGNPVPRKERPLEVRLRETGWTVTESGCWEWSGKRNDGGYGIFSARRLGYENVRAHRVMYEHFVGPIPEGLEMRHRCDNPPCVNPEHLEPGTHAQNMADIFDRGRAPSQNRTECANGHDLTLPGALRQTKRERICVECARARARRYMQRQRAS